MTNTDAETEAAPDGQRPFGTRLSLGLVALSFAAPFVSLFVLMLGGSPWLSFAIALSSSAIGLAAIVVAVRARRAAKRAARPTWAPILAIVLSAFMFLPSSALGGAAALVEGAVAADYYGIPTGGRYYDEPEPWGWDSPGSACGSWTCMHVPSGRNMAVGASVLATFAGIAWLVGDAPR